MLNGSACLTIFERVRYCVLTVLVTWYLLYLFHNNVMSSLLLACLVCFCLLVLKIYPIYFVTACYVCICAYLTHHSRFRQPKPDLFHFIERFVCLWQIRKSWKSNIKSRKIDYLDWSIYRYLFLFFLKTCLTLKMKLHSHACFEIHNKFQWYFQWKCFV